MKKHKTLGQVYTPEWVVNEILDLIEYNSEDILDKYILEPSCGDGVFLEEIVRRYINISIKTGLKKDIIINNLEKYIWGIEIDEIEYKKCIFKLNELIKLNLETDLTVNWNISNENTLFAYNDKLLYFDFIVGNPPYIRIHNLDIETRNILKNEFLFSEGTIDIYLSFFEMGIKMLKATGKLGFITPNSYLHNSSYSKFRDFLKTNRLVEILIDFKANKIFKGFSTYTAITILNKSSKNDYFEYKELEKENIISINKINYKSLNSKDWSFADTKDADFINNLDKNKNGFIKDYFDVQYGFATLRDKIFISNVTENNDETVIFNGHLIEKGILKKIVKGSKYKGDVNTIDYIIFPYYLDKTRYKPICEVDLRNTYPLAYKYLLQNKEELIKRDLDKGSIWYEFGRSQGIQSIHKEKIVLSTLVNGAIKYYKLPSDIFVYSGIFITKNNLQSNWDLIEKTLDSDDFYRFIRITGKDFSGGYKSITSKQIKEFKINSPLINKLF